MSRRRVHHGRTHILKDELPKLPLPVNLANDLLLRDLLSEVDALVEVAKVLANGWREVEHERLLHALDRARNGEEVELVVVLEVAAEGGAKLVREKTPQSE